MICAHFSVGQSLSGSDSLQVRNAVRELFENFDDPNYSKFEKISTDVIWCLICNSAIPLKADPQKMSRKEFYDKNLKDITNSQNWIRASKSRKIKLFIENKSSNEVTALITTWEKNEYALGHEGAQIGIHFEKVKGIFKFSGIESIP
jgi:hypothetical protein